MYSIGINSYKVANQCSDTWIGNFFYLKLINKKLLLKKMFIVIIIVDKEKITKEVIKFQRRNKKWQRDLY